MDHGLAWTINEQLSRSGRELGHVAALSGAFSATFDRTRTGGPWAEAKEVLLTQFRWLLDLVNKGGALVVGVAPEEQVVVISMRDLASLLALGNGSISFAEAVEMRPGFETVEAAPRLRQRARASQSYATSGGRSPDAP